MNSDRQAQMWVVGIFLAVIIGVTVLAAFASNGSAGPSASRDFKATTAAAITSSDWARGAENSEATVIEYGDFQCPACGAYEPMVEELQKEYASNVKFVFRNFPLLQVHPNAMIAAQAAEAAGLQGKYWEMHDLLYTKQSEWAEESGSTILEKYFDPYAQSIGLNVQKFNTDINSQTVKQKIESDIASGNAASVDHTPTFFVNLTQIPNPGSLKEFKSAIDMSIASSTQK